MHHKQCITSKHTMHGLQDSSGRYPKPCPSVACCLWCLYMRVRCVQKEADEREDRARARERTLKADMTARVKEFVDAHGHRPQLTEISGDAQWKAVVSSFLLPRFVHALVYAYVRKSARIHPYTYTYMYTYTPTSTLTHTHKHIHTCTHTHAHTQTRTHTRTHTHARTNTHTHTYTHTHTHTHTCYTISCICPHTCFLHTSQHMIRIYKCTHTHSMRSSTPCELATASTPTRSSLPSPGRMTKRAPRCTSQYQCRSQRCPRVSKTAIQPRVRTQATQCRYPPLCTSVFQTSFPPW